MNLSRRRYLIRIISSQQAGNILSGNFNDSPADALVIIFDKWHRLKSYTFKATIYLISINPYVQVPPLILQELLNG